MYGFGAGALPDGLGEDWCGFGGSGRLFETGCWPPALLLLAADKDELELIITIIYTKKHKYNRIS